MPEQEGSHFFLGLEFLKSSQEVFIVIRIYAKILKSLLKQQTTKDIRKFGSWSLTHSFFLFVQCLVQTYAPG